MHASVSGWYRQRGVTLLEVLITMVVLSIGLLGFAALQTVSMKSNRTALYRSYATTYAYDILDCIRANRASAGAYAVSVGTAPPSSPTTVAQRDLGDWLTGLAANMPNGLGGVAIAGNAVTITVQWDESPTDTKSFTTSSSF
nr:type IV pilus modification protein PilV [Thiocystis violacea]